MLSADSLIPISVATLVPSTTMGLDLFQRDDADRCVLYRGAEYPLQPDDLQRLRDKGIHQLFITRDSRSQYQEYLREIAAGGDGDPDQIQARTCAMNEVVLDVLENSFAAGDTNETVSVVQQLGDITAQVVSTDGFKASDLFAVLHHDYATFTHSANVAFYAAMLGSKLGYGEEAVSQIVVGGLLHDLGKLDIAEKILCKPGRLDEDEFRVIKQHPTVGFRKLARRGDLSEGQLMMVYQHHERNDGRGYPVGVMGKEIHPWAKICAVVDVFEALTSQRPYRTPMPRTKAFELIERDSGTAFEEEMVRCWKAIISHGSDS
ncbi:HD-GYP domain-containing protein [Crateriforma conspicua]|uniref:HD-GYP domain-containing protein n=1 Tax=Crateriforma conspicua TaxID=2527996 RepID=UPI00118AA4D4|nr:HD domain-containing phosphohydrolase [Crateriforma conspicua]QDV60986.1 Cyclic di-GMP phosphodiesterase response regulator RpfG [Crateriforma conspicua]